MGRGLLNILIIALFVLAFAGTASASFLISTKPVTNDIYKNEIGYFELTIKNNNDYVETYQVYTSDVSWRIGTDPQSVKVDPGDEKIFTVSVHPTKWTTTGPQGVSLVVKSTVTDKKFESNLLIYVRPDEIPRLDYIPSIQLTADIPTNIDPRSKIQLGINLRNRNSLDIDELTLVISSIHFNKKEVFPLNPLEEKSFEYVFELDPLTEPLDDELVITAYIGNESISQVIKNVEIISYSDLIEDTTLDQKFLKSAEVTTYYNDGNVRTTKQVRMETGFLDSFFASYSPKPTNSVKKEIRWEFELGPREDFTITVVKNYRSLLYLLILLGIIFGVYFLMRSPIIAKKEVMIIGSAEEGISEMKIIIYAKNRTQQPVNNIYVSDKIPPLAELIKDGNLGTMEPSKILSHDKKGTLIKWDIPVLDPYEERIITYKIKSKLNIVGGVTLPAARIKFESSAGREKSINSNKCNVDFRYK